MKFFNNCIQRRHRSIELCPTVSEVTPEGANIWAALPYEIRRDPSLIWYQRHHERANGIVDSNDKAEDTEAENITTHIESIARDSSINNELVKNNIDEDNKNQVQNGDSVVHLNLNHQSTSDDTQQTRSTSKSTMIFNTTKIALLVAVWMLFTVILMSKDEKVLDYHQLAIPIKENKSYVLDEMPVGPRFGVIVCGTFAEHNNSSRFLYLQVRLDHKHIEDGNNHSNNSFTIYYENIVEIPIVEHIDKATEVTKSYIFHLDSEILKQIELNDTILSLEISSNMPVGFPINLAFDPSPIDKSLGIIYAAIVLLSLYIVIIWEIIDRTFAAIIASTMSIAILTMMNERPTMLTILSWIDVETLLLLFGMMILVGILSETGLFDYFAVYAFKITKGEPWSLIYCLCLFTAFLSAMLDNVTTLLLMTPVSIRLCEIMKLNPIPILMSMIIFSNIGGSMTPVGDPPNIIIASNTHVIKNGVNFLNFTIHMSIGAVLVMIQTYFQLRFRFRTINDLRVNEPDDIKELRNDIALWQHAALQLTSSSRDEDLVRTILSRKVERLQQELMRKITCGSISNETYKRTLKELQEKYPIRNRTLLIQSSIALAFVIVCFFFHSFPYIERLSLGWTALLGAILLLILADRRDIESIFEHVEWTTLVFFAVLFVLMESLAKLGLIEFIGNQTENIILMVNESFRLTVAILIILWVSAIASAFVDNIPLTTMMIRVIISLASKTALNIPLQPLVWALSFGACLGGNGTLIGASANIICAAVAQQNGYAFSFMHYFKVGFPVMIGSLVIASGYLLVCHIFFLWH